MNNFEIIPYVSVGDLKFGMSRQAVRAILGSLTSSRNSRFSKKVTEYWLENQLRAVFTSEDGPLSEIVLSRELKDVNLDGSFIFQKDGPTGRAELCAKDGSPKVRSGGIFLFNLGIALAEFDNLEEDQRTITAFDRATWDPSDPCFVDFSGVT